MTIKRKYEGGASLRKLTPLLNMDRFRFIGMDHYASGSLSISLSINFWIARASAFVTPSLLPEQSAFALPCSVSLYLEGLEIDCMMITASEISTVPSQLASPYVTFAGVSEETVVVVVAADVVAAVVVVVSVCGSSPSAYS